MNKKDAVREYFTAKQAAALSGLSVSMIDYLCRTDIVTPSCKSSRGRGVARQYQFADVVVLKAVRRLLSGGLSVLRLRRALSGLRKRHSEITAKSIPGMLLITDGKTVYLRGSGESVEDLIRGQLAFAFVIELGALSREIGAKLAPLPGKGVQGRRANGSR